MEKLRLRSIKMKGRWGVWRLEKPNPSHLNPLNFICFDTLCERVNTFEDIFCVYMRARIYETSRSLRAEPHHMFAFFYILFHYFRPYIHPFIDSPYKVSQVLDLFFQLPDLKNQLADLSMPTRRVIFWLLLPHKNDFIQLRSRGG